MRMCRHVRSTHDTYASRRECNYSVAFKLSDMLRNSYLVFHSTEEFADIRVNRVTALDFGTLAIARLAGSRGTYMGATAIEPFST